MPVVSPWILLLVAGLLEVVWAVGLKYTEGFTKLVPSAVTLAAMGVSIILLGKAAQHLPIGTAYAVWVGIGAVGAAIFGAILFSEAVTVPRVLSLCLLVVSLVALKLTTPSGEP